MDYNSKFFQFYNYLKEKELISTYVELAEILNTNKAGINDLKSGKKKLSLENIFSMKKSYPFLNLDWFYSDEEDMLITKTKSKEKTNKENVSLNVSNIVRKPNVKKTLTNENKDTYSLVLSTKDETIAQLKELVQDLRQDKNLLTEQIKDLKQDKERAYKDRDNWEHRYNMAQLELDRLKNVQDLGDTHAGVG